MVQLKLSVMLCLLMVVLASAQAADELRPATKQRTLFADWLTAKPSSGPQEAHLSSNEAPGYSNAELQKEFSCLKLNKVDACRCIGCGAQCDSCGTCCAKTYQQAVFGCAADEDEERPSAYGTGHKAKHTSFLGGRPLNTAYCDFVFNTFDNVEVMPYAPNVTKTGTFRATCYMNEAAGLCGHPFCAGMVITVAGGAVFNAKHVSSMTNPATPPIEVNWDGGCNTFGPTGQRSPSARGKKAPRATKAATLGHVEEGDRGYEGNGYGYGSAAQEQQHEGGSSGSGGYELSDIVDAVELLAADNIWVGDATILAGPMQVTGQSQYLKVQQHGWFELVASWTPTGQVDGFTAAKSCYEVQPYKANLVFANAQSYGSSYSKQE